jgi:dienelactone hydrolase
MRPLELLLVLSCAALAIRAAGPERGIDAHGWMLALKTLVVLVLAGQLLLEGWRWQMFPTYAVAIGLLSLAVDSIGASLLFWSASAALVLLAVSILSCLALPYRMLPTLGGSFPVGTTSLPGELLREARNIPTGGPPVDAGQPLPQVQLWYPAALPSHDSRDVRSWLSGRARVLFEAQLPSPASSDVPVAPTRYRMPVLLYFPGWPETRIQNVSLIRELASRGFLVATVHYPAKLREMSEPAFRRELAIVERPMMDYSSDLACAQSVQLNNDRARAHARDATLILDVLLRFDRGEVAHDRLAERFRSRLDTQRAGVFGFSFGGGVAAEAGRLDGRIRAVVNMDGRHWADALQYGVEQPYLFIGEELLMPSAAALSSPDRATRYEAALDQVDYTNLAANLRRHGGIQVTIADTAHMNYTDDPLRSPLRRLSGGGRIDAERAREIIGAYVTTFFLHYLPVDPDRQPALELALFPDARVTRFPSAASAGQGVAPAG